MDIRLDFSDVANSASIRSHDINQGLIFSDNAIAVRSRQLGGQGNFTANGTDGTLVTYGNGEAMEISVAETVPAIVAAELTLRYTSPHLDHRLQVLDRDGNVIDDVRLPKTPVNLPLGGKFDNLQTITFEMTGEARSFLIGSFANQSGTRTRASHC